MLNLLDTVYDVGAAPVAARLQPARAASPHDRAAGKRPGTPARRRIGGVAAGVLAMADAASFALAAMALGVIWIVVIGISVVGVYGAMPLRAAALMAVATVLVNASSGLYPGQRLAGAERLRRRVRTGATVAAVAALSAFVLAGDPFLALVLALQAAIALAAQPAFAGLARMALHRAGMWTRPAVVIGSGAARDAVERRLGRDWTLGLAPVGGGSGFARSGTEAAVAVVADPRATADDLAQLATRYQEVIVLAGDPHEPAGRLRPGDIGGATGLVVARRRAGQSDGAIRRALDLAVAVPATAVALPIIGTAAAAVYAVDPGPVFYRQRREGRDGRPINVIKIRTMYRDADARLGALLERDPAAREEWARTYKLRNDPRILPGVGNILRSSSIDELPQLLNVLGGSMSVVGPRPFPHYHLDAMDPAFRAKRCSITPGLSGLLQIEMRSDADLETQCRFDDWYIDNRSLWLDLDILLRTFAAVIRRSGAY